MYLSINIFFRVNKCESGIDWTNKNRCVTEDYERRNTIIFSKFLFKDIITITTYHNGWWLWWRESQLCWFGQQHGKVYFKCNFAVFNCLICQGIGSWQLQLASSDCLLTYNIKGEVKSVLRIGSAQCEDLKCEHCPNFECFEFFWT